MSFFGGKTKAKHSTAHLIFERNLCERAQPHEKVRDDAAIRIVTAIVVRAKVKC